MSGVGDETGLGRPEGYLAEIDVGVQLRVSMYLVGHRLHRFAVAIEWLGEPN